MYRSTSLTTRAGYSTLSTFVEGGSSSKIVFNLVEALANIALWAGINDVVFLLLLLVPFPH